MTAWGHGAGAGAEPPLWLWQGPGRTRGWREAQKFSQRLGSPLESGCRAGERIRLALLRCLISCAFTEGTGDTPVPSWRAGTSPPSGPLMSFSPSFHEKSSFLGGFRCLPLSGPFSSFPPAPIPTSPGPSIHQNPFLLTLGWHGSKLGMGSPCSRRFGRTFLLAESSAWVTILLSPLRPAPGTGTPEPPRALRSPAAPRCQRRGGQWELQDRAQRAETSAKTAATPLHQQPGQQEEQGQLQIGLFPHPH